jgi:manganese/iron transport system permease protein
MSLHTLLLPFDFAFMQNAFLIAILVSVPTALLSCFLVLKGWALMGDAVSHAVLPGIVLAYIFGLPLIVGAFAAGMTCALATGYLSQNSRIKPDTIMGVVFSGMFGIGIVLYVAVETNVHLDHILFGNMLGVTSDELWLAGLISLGVSAAIAMTWKDLLLHSFDPTQAQAAGLRVNWLHYGLLAALSLTIVATLAAAGLILAIGLLIAPGAIAFLVVRSFGAMLLVAIAACMSSMLLGTYLSFFIDSAPAPTIVLIMTAVFLVAFARRLILTRQRSRRTIATERQTI